MPLLQSSIAKRAVQQLGNGNRAVLFAGDCRKLLAALPDGAIDLTLTSPPYCMGKSYDTSREAQEFVEVHRQLLPEVVRITADGGSICWQVGYHVDEGRLLPLDFLIYEILSKIDGVQLRNRIIWSFAHGAHCSKRFSGRHEVVLWFTKGASRFDLDAVRVPQKYPGKRHYKGPHRGELSGNPKGKNPGDVWEIPNVKSNHVEKTLHPCQFPIALAQRLIRALTTNNEIVLDPFAGVATTGLAALLDGRRFIGAEIDSKFRAIAKERFARLDLQKLEFRPIEKAIHVPRPTDAVARRPHHFAEWSH